MAAFGKITIGILNVEGMRALIQAAQLAQEIVDEQPWNEEAKEIVACLSKAAESLGIVC